MKRVFLDTNILIDFTLGREHGGRRALIKCRNSFLFIKELDNDIKRTFGKDVTSSPKVYILV